MSSFISASANAITIPRPVQPIKGDIILLDVRTCEWTIRNVIEEIIPLFKLQFPDHEVFLDGDQYAIIARPKVME